ncbi:MAG TPA: YihY/virulence factor BrkB family protein, partial [Candidatus Nocardiopsis merdipullorum]|nr:YihY/virulence factor BrkB family protein [Candidatus Nocardiopsis merdipullorum]
MVSVLDRAKNTVRRHQNLAMDLYWETRQRHPAVDHLVRAYERYSDGNGTQLASAVTYYAFLSFFPLLALAFAVVGFLAARNVELTDHLNKALEAVLPGLSEQLPVEQIAEARVGAGLLGVLGLLYTGLNVVSELRRALHSIWLRDPGEGPGFVLRKLGDLVVMIGLGVALLVTVSFTGVVQTATSWLLALVGLEGSGLAF